MGSLEIESTHSSEVLKSLDLVLTDFGLSRKNGKSVVQINGEIPDPKITHSENLNLSMIGTVPSLANALTAAQIFEMRGGGDQVVAVDIARGHNYLDPDVGMTPSLNGQEVAIDVIVGNPFLHNIFETKDGRQAVISAVYVDLVYKWLTFLDCSPQVDAARAAVLKWESQRKLNQLETAAEMAGLPMAIVQDESEWLQMEQGRTLSQLPPVPLRKVGLAPAKPFPAGRPKRPLEGLKVLCCTHAVAGPSAGRTLAEHGATVLQVIFTHGFEHHFVWQNANLGCASTRLSFHKESDIERLWTLVKEADVWIDSYRENAISKFGFTDEKLVAANPNLIISHVRCYGQNGPWARKPGFDMQASASSGMMALCGKGSRASSFPPGLMINDYTTGYFGALAIQAALIQRTREGGAYILSPSLTSTAMAILRYWKAEDSPQLKVSTAVALPPRQISGYTPAGYLNTLAPLPQMSLTMPRYEPILLVPLGSSPPMFQGSDNTWSPGDSKPQQRAALLQNIGLPMEAKLKQIRETARKLAVAA